MNKLTSLAKLASRLGVNKSKLNYYAWKKLIKPVEVCGRTMVFDEENVAKQLKFIEQEKENGLTLEAIRKKLNA